MFDLILENAAGDQLTFVMGSPFTVVDIDGLYPPDATINTSEQALLDGARYNSAKVNMRTLMIAFAIETDPARNRIEVFKVLKSKQYVKMYYNGEYRQVYAEGYIERINISYWKMKQIVTCTILCPDPYFKEAQEIVDGLHNIVNAFHFPFSSTATPQIVFGYFAVDTGVTVANDGDVECGMIIELQALAAVTNPKILDYNTGEYIGLAISMQAGDVITLDTRATKKTATLLRSGVTTNVFNYVMAGSTWLQLPANGSTFVYEVGTGFASDLVIMFKHHNLYEGV